MMRIISSVILICISTHSSAYGVSLGVFNLKQKIEGRMIEIPTSMDLDIQSGNGAVDMQVTMGLNLTDVQRQLDSIAKSLPIPRDNCPSYGQHIVARVNAASITPAGDKARLRVDAHLEIWDCQKGIPATGTTVRWKLKCVKILGEKICTKVPVKVEVKPGPDIKNRLVSEDIWGTMDFALTSVDGQGLTLVPSNVQASPRGDWGKILNRIAGFSQKDLASLVRTELAALVDAGVLRQSIPKEISAYDPKITHATFSSLETGGLGASITFKARLSGEQLNRMIAGAIGAE